MALVHDIKYYKWSNSFKINTTVESITIRKKQTAFNLVPLRFILLIKNLISFPNNLNRTINMSHCEIYIKMSQKTELILKKDGSGRFRQIRRPTINKEGLNNRINNR